MQETTYNGWRNWQTWNVALWISNDETLNRQASVRRCQKNPYGELVVMLMDRNINRTLDGVRYDDPSIDHDEINSLIRGTL